MTIAEDTILNSLEALKSRIRTKPVQDRQIDLEEDHTKQLIDALHALGEVEVLVGIPEENNERDDGSSIGNAALGYIHETGSPASNIPARPFLYPGVYGSKDKWLKLMQLAGEQALNFDQGGMMKALDSAGAVAATAAQMVIQAGIKPLLKRPRYKKGREPQRPQDATPLYDSGNLMRSITYVVEKRGG